MKKKKGTLLQKKEKDFCIFKSFFFGNRSEINMRPHTFFFWLLALTVRLHFLILSEALLII